MKTVTITDNFQREEETMLTKPVRLSDYIAYAEAHSHLIATRARVVFEQLVAQNKIDGCTCDPVLMPVVNHVLRIKHFSPCPAWCAPPTVVPAASKIGVA